MLRITKARQSQVALSQYQQYAENMSCVVEPTVQLHLHPEGGDNSLHLLLTVTAFRQLQAQFAAVAHELYAQEQQLIAARLYDLQCELRVFAARLAAGGRHKESNFAALRYGVYHQEEMRTYAMGTSRGTELASQNTWDLLEVSLLQQGQRMLIHLDVPLNTLTISVKKDHFSFPEKLATWSLTDWFRLGADARWQELESAAERSASWRWEKCRDLRYAQTNNCNQLRAKEDTTTLGDFIPEEEAV